MTIEEVNDLKIEAELRIEGILTELKNQLKGPVKISSAEIDIYKVKLAGSTSIENIVANINLEIKE